MSVGWSYTYRIEQYHIRAILYTKLPRIFRHITQRNSDNDLHCKDAHDIWYGIDVAS